jgi:thiamine-monophosphate kinase
MGRIRLGPGAEFDLIRSLLERDASLRERLETAAPGTGSVLVGPGDDCAVVYGPGIALSVDLSIEGVHFRREWLEPPEIGWRATAAALSDLAAVAAEPVGILVALGLPRAAEADAGGLMTGVSEVAATYGAVLLGGDVSRSHGPIVIDIVAVGRTGAPILRSGVRPGDAICVTGHLGGAAAAVAAWERGREPDPVARAAFARPHPRLAEARWLAERGALHAAIDLSDGLAGDAGHLASASNVRILLDLAAVPIHPAALGRDADRAAGLALALGGGDDYELCFAGPADTCAELADAFRREFDAALTRVGEAEPGEGLFAREGQGAEPRPLSSGGYSHIDGQA